jgi:RNA polymerase sigma-70 factor, ECF subfamily
LEERDLVAAFLESQGEATFSALFNPLCARLFRYFTLRGLDPLTAEELAQNVLLAVYRHGGEVRDQALFYGWFYRIARNELAAYWRQQNARAEWIVFESLDDELTETLASESESELVLNFAALLDRLEPHERELIVLRFVEGLSYQELAVALQIPLGRVKWRLSNTKTKLARIIEDSSFRSPLTQRVN